MSFLNLIVLIWNELIAIYVSGSGSNEDFISANDDTLNMVFGGGDDLLASINRELKYFLDYWARP